MDCCCESGMTNQLKLQGDVDTDPIWCEVCGCNLEIEDLPISNDLAKELDFWAEQYGEWIDWETDRLLSNGVELEDHYNGRGVLLTEKLQTELGDSYKIVYSPSTSARLYAQK